MMVAVSFAREFFGLLIRYFEGHERVVNANILADDIRSFLLEI